MTGNKLQQKTSVQLLPTGIAGLDKVLRGGLAPDRLYLVEGEPGAGKTTLALQFLLEGLRHGERCMFIALSESSEELNATAESHGWSLEGIRLLEITASPESLQPDSRYTMFHPSEVELAETTRQVLAASAEWQPTRLVFDSLSEMRLLAENSLRYRRQVLALKQHFSRQRCTVLLLDDRTGGARDMHVHSLAHGVISLERDTAEYGSIRRRVQVRKLRGRAFREGYHDFHLRQGGLEVFPRLVAAEHHSCRDGAPMSSGVPALDALMGGGLSRGTSTLITGAAGTGKSSVATQYAMAAANRGEPVILFLFDEAIANFKVRSVALGMDVAPLIEQGLMQLQQINPAEMSPGEFAQRVQDGVIRQGARMIVIDSLNGYLSAMPSEHFLMLHLHELLTTLGQQGVVTLLVMAQQGLVGSNVDSPVDASYVADAVMLLRYFEANGEVRKAVSVIKRRTGPHERTIRELRVDGQIMVGGVVSGFTGVLSGNPQYVGNGGLNQAMGDPRLGVGWRQSDGADHP